MRNEEGRLRDALREIAEVLGTGDCPQQKCEGCAWEHAEAAHLARAALEASPPERSVTRDFDDLVDEQYRRDRGPLFTVTDAMVERHALWTLEHNTRGALTSFEGRPADRRTYMRESRLALEATMGAGT